MTANHFVAVAPDPAARRDLAALLAGAPIGRAAADGARVRLERPERWHVTVAFLGELAGERVAEAGGALAAGARAWREWAAAPLTLRVAGGGRFGRGRATVLWADLGGAVGELRHLRRQVTVALRRAALPYDDRPYRPHLTLARPGDRWDVAADLAVLATYAGPAWTAGELRLMRSDPAGYQLVADAPLLPLG